MTKPDSFLSTIPFAGFYYTLHDEELSRPIETAIDCFCEDTGADIPQALADRLWDNADYGAARREYAQEYAASFLQWLGLDGSFESMSSPNGYNFETDRIFVTLTRADVARLWRMTPRDILDKVARDRFTSRSGFISHYAPDWRDWGPVSTWDHNQIGTLVYAVANYEQDGTHDGFDMWAEYELMEGYLCNGGPGNALCQSQEYVRALNIADYLRDRARRPIRTMAQWRAARRAENRPFNGTPLGQWAFQ